MPALKDRDMADRLLSSPKERKAIEQAYKRLVEERSFLLANWSGLLRMYKDQWIAVQEQKVVGNASDLRELLNVLGNKGIQPSQTLLEYVTDKPTRLLL